MNMINKRKGQRGQSGFTLIELLVAVAILAILAGVAVFAVGNLTGQSESSACKTEAETIRTAVASARAATADGSTPNPKFYTTYLQGGPKYFTTADVAVTSAPVTVNRKTTGAGSPADGPSLAECENLTGV